MSAKEKYKVYNNLASKFYNEVFEIINKEFQQEKFDKHSKSYFILSFIAIIPLLLVGAQLQKLVDGLITKSTLQLPFLDGLWNILPTMLFFILIYIIKKFTLDPLWKIQDSKYSKSEYKKHLYNIKQKISQSIPSGSVYSRLENLIDEINNNNDSFHAKKQFVLSGIIQVSMVAILSPFFSIISRDDVDMYATIVITSLIIIVTGLSVIFSYYRYFFRNIEPMFGRNLGEIETKNIIRDILYYRDRLDDYVNGASQEFNSEEMLTLLKKINEQTEKFKLN
ncbi:hypothetical protein ACS6Y5_07785 [Streptococcus suis]|uniref:hypothetical protein n=1 Tax=Streptococcus TaxID=1301 RepID=UPI002AA4504F|nr:hypothetical protein [Streptococcus suis]HEM6489304.1 hypothetical protein [Streptococcus suis]